MKVELSENKYYTPISITLETQEEADIIWILLNQADGSMDFEKAKLKSEMWKIFDSIHKDMKEKEIIKFVTNYSVVV